MTFRMYLVGLMFSGFVSFSSTTRAVITTIGSAKDNTIFSNNSLNSAGGWAGITAGTNSTGAARRGLIAFDIAGNVPDGSIITSAQLTLYLGDLNNSNSQTVELHKLTKDWGEGTANSTPSFSGTGMGAAASPGDATWSHAMLGSARFFGQIRGRRVTLIQLPAPVRWLAGLSILRIPGSPPPRWSATYRIGSMHPRQIMAGH